MISTTGVILTFAVVNKYITVPYSQIFFLMWWKLKYITFEENVEWMHKMWRPYLLNFRLEL